MPCYDPRDNDPAAISAEARARAMTEFTHNSPVAEMLCSVMKILHPQDRPRVAEMVPGLKVWWAEHQARDAAKEQGNGRPA